MKNEDERNKKRGDGESRKEEEQEKGLEEGGGRQRKSAEDEEGKQEDKATETYRKDEEMRRGWGVGVSISAISCLSTNLLVVFLKIPFGLGETLEILFNVALWYVSIH